MNDEIQNYMARPKRYDNIDGTGEMFMGLMLLAFALLGYLQGVLPAHSIWRSNALAGLVFMYAVLIPVLGLGFVLQRVVKKRITWPRTGYVAYARDKKTLLKGMFAIGLIAAVIGAVIAVSFTSLMLLGKKHPIAISFSRVGYLAFWVPVYAFWVYRMGRGQPWKWLVVLFMALGLVVIGLTISGNFVDHSWPVTLFVGLVWFFSGGATLVSYLRHTQPPDKETA